MLLDCHVDIDSLWMVSWEDRSNVEIGSRTGVSDWRSVLCCVALLSCLPEFMDMDCLTCFSAVGKNCVLDLNARGTYNRVRLPECGLETVAQMPPIQHCRVAEVPSDTVAQVHGCTRMHTVYVWSVTGSLLFGSQTCKGLTAVTLAFSGSDV